jgi:hypothetical protein
MRPAGFIGWGEMISAQAGHSPRGTRSFDREVKRPETASSAGTVWMKPTATYSLRGIRRPGRERQSGNSALCAARKRKGARADLGAQIFSTGEFEPSTCFRQIESS